MKGIVLEHNKKGVYVLDREGGFHLVSGFTGKPIGAEIEFGTVKKKPFFKGLRIIYIFERFALAMACLLLLVCVSSFAYQANTVSCYVYVDINPSVELVINNLGRCMSSQGLNEHGDDLLDGQEIKGTMEEAILTVLTKAENDGYRVFGDDSQASITFVPGDDGHTQELILRFSQLFANNDLDGIALYACDKDSRDLASSMGVSPAKLDAVGNLYLVDLDIDPEEILNESLKLIKDMIRNSFIGDIIGRDR